MAKGIGRLISIGIAKETTRGTAESSASYWLPFSDANLDEKFENVKQDEAYGVIEDSVGEFRTKNQAEGTLKVPLTDKSLPLILLAALGANADSTHSGETVVYDHTATVDESAQHQSLTLFLHDPISGVDYSHALGVISKLDLDVELKKFANLSLSVKALKGVSQSTFSPAIAAENRFLPQYMTFASAPSVAGALGTLAATGTASSTTALTGLSISTTLLKIGMTVTGANVAAGTTITAIVSASAVTLSTATTGSATSFTFGGAAVKLKSFKLSINKNIEDDDVLGSAAPIDYLNKEFSVDGSFEAIWENESDFKTAALATPTTPQSLYVVLKNTDVTIGSASHPTVAITLDQTYFTEISRPFKVKDLVYQTIKFRATYSTATSEMVNILTTNAVASY